MVRRVRSIACVEKQGRTRAKFTALLHHVSVERLREAYFRLRKDASPGVDGVTWRQYGEDLEDNLVVLHARLHRGAYRAKPSRRVYIPKAIGGHRPLGIASLEDKIVQRAVVEVMNAIYEQDFVGFSYGFRPGRGQHDALDALAVGLATKRVSWVLDADIRGFFDAIDHEGNDLTMEHFPSALQVATSSSEDLARNPTKPFLDGLSDKDRHRRAILVDLFRAQHGNVSAVAKEMGKARNQIHRWVRKYGINPEDYRS
jgi:hypothetical protein